jgi:alanine racemase
MRGTMSTTDPAVAVMARPPADPRLAKGRATAVVDLSAVRDNARFFAGRIAGGLMAVVKADGYGHGAVPLARAAVAGGAAWLGVTSIDEALQLRRAGLSVPILSWLNAVDADFDSALQQRIDLAVASVLHLDAVTAAAARTGRRARVHLHLDTGIARDGATAAEWPELLRRTASARGHVRPAGVMGHLGCAAEPEDPHNAEAREVFEWGIAATRRAGLTPRVLHLAATAATLNDPRTHYDVSRIGAGLVGIDPSGRTALRPAMSLHAPVLLVRDVPAGTPIGYHHGHVTERATRLALLPLGYADGVPRAATGSGEVLLHGRRCRLIGAVSMDQIVIDVGDVPVVPDDVATVFGPGADGEPTVAEWARWAGTIEQDIVARIGQRIIRRYVRGA